MSPQPQQGAGGDFGRPGYVSLQAGGRQDFPTDPINDARLRRESRNQAAQEGRKLTRRIPALKV